MCGICGFLNLSNSGSINRDNVRDMCQVMQHRGPDDEGVYVALPDRQGQFSVALGHRRLSIIDLSAQGHQPMSNEDGTIWIVYNGEIYNFLELKDFLISKGHIFKSHTDTEVIIHLFEEEGIDCVRHLRGMFAFAIWDEKKRSIFIARDRLGIKPLYYHYNKGTLIFASEIKSILASKQYNPSVNKNILDAYLTLGYVPAPDTMFAGICKLSPGHYMFIDEKQIRIEKYWDIEDLSSQGHKSEKQYVDEFLSLLNDCVRMRLISDVPLGVFLSGGIDSSTVVGIMSHLSNVPVKTFTVGYKEKDASEIEYARIVAQHFKTEHHEFYLEPANFYEIIPKLVWYFDEPVADAAAIPLYFISKLAREHVTVLLSGEGADELFAGYEIYNFMQRIELYQKIPQPLRDSLLNSIVTRFIKYGKQKEKFLEWSRLPIEKRYLGVPVETINSFRKKLFNPAFSNGINAQEKSAEDYLDHYYSICSNKDMLSRMLYVDTKVWLPDDLLVKADKMSMATSVELRVPFLDYKMVEFAATVPSKLKIKNGIGKYLIKKSVKDLLPREIIYRRKRGFPVPINAWFKGDFSQKAADVLLDDKSIRRGYFNKDFIVKVIKEHKEGRENFSKQLYSLLVLEFWHNVFIDNR